MSKSAFVHLHNHTDYSLLDSTIRIDGLIAKALEYNMPAVAITDSNNMCGVINFYCKCKKAGVKPIIGAEISVTSVVPKRDEQQADTVYKIVLLCMNLTGYRNLCRIVSSACLKGFREVTPVTPGILAAHSEGLICLSGGSEGELAVLAGIDHDDATSVAAWYDEHFPDRYYIELFPEPTHALATMMSISRELDIPVVAAADCHCHTLEDVAAYQVLRCIRAGTTLDQLCAKKPMIEPLFHPPEKMQEMFGDCPEALANTLKISDRCNVELPMGKYHTPRIDMREGMSAYGLLEQFINPERVVNPDIEIDSCVNRREGVINYLVHKYGQNRVCRIPTFTSFSIDSAILETARTMKISHSRAKKIQHLYHRHMDERYPGCESDLPKLRKQNLPWWRRGNITKSDLNEMAKNEPKIKELLTVAIELSGQIRFCTINATSYVIAPEDLREYIPLSGDPDSEIKISHYTMKNIKRLGLIKCVG